MPTPTNLTIRCAINLLSLNPPTTIWAVGVGVRVGVVGMASICCTSHPKGFTSIPLPKFNQIKDFTQRVT